MKRVLAVAITLLCAAPVTAQDQAYPLLGENISLEVREFSPRTAPEKVCIVVERMGGIRTECFGRAHGVDTPQEHEIVHYTLPSVNVTLQVHEITLRLQPQITCLIIPGQDDISLTCFAKSR